MLLLFYRTDTAIYAAVTAASNYCLKPDAAGTITGIAAGTTAGGAG